MFQVASPEAKVALLQDKLQSKLSAPNQVRRAQMGNALRRDPQTHKIQVKVETSRPDKVKVKETLTAKTSTEAKKRKNGGEKPRKNGTKTSTTGDQGKIPSKPPRKKASKPPLPPTSASSIPKPPPGTPTPGTPSKSPTPTRIPAKRLNYTVTHRPLAPPAEDAVSYARRRRIGSPPPHSSLPCLTPYLSETKRVTESVFLQGGRSLSPRPTKTSLMREIIAREPDWSMKPRQKRRRSVSCLNLKDYNQYILTLRHSHVKSPRFSRLHKLYSSLERLGELEKSAGCEAPSVLPPSKANDFDAWWKVRNRLRVEEEMATISKELWEAQRNREFYFRPETPKWKPDAHLRFKKWSVEELKYVLESSPTSNLPPVKDAYKTLWRGVTVKESALNLEVTELYKQHPDAEHKRKHIGSTNLRRAFSMSSTLTQEQREGIKHRIGSLIQAAKSKQDLKEGLFTKDMVGGRPITTTPHGFTLSSLPKKDLEPPTSAVALSERRKKEISHKISEELKERRKLASSSTPTSCVPISTKIALRKVESLRTPVRPYYSIYSTGGVGEKVKVFERSPSPPPRPASPATQKEYVSHISVISKLASLLLRRNTHLRSLITREILERDKLERFRTLHCGEVERLRDFFEEKELLEELRTRAKSPEELNLLRCLFCSDSNLSKITHHHDTTRAAPDGSSPTPTTTTPVGTSRTTTTTTKKHETISTHHHFLGTRSRRPIYQPSSTPNVCQPTLTAHYKDSYEALDYDSLPASLSYANYDPSAHQPRFRWVPPPPNLKRPASAYIRRAESFAGRRKRYYYNDYGVV